MLKLITVAMYNKYNNLIYADEEEILQKHLKCKEVDHRPTSDSYDLLAWSYLNIRDKSARNCESSGGGKII
jgi:hypothetical protein